MDEESKEGIGKEKEKRKYILRVNDGRMKGEKKRKKESGGRRSNRRGRDKKVETRRRRR